MTDRSRALSEIERYWHETGLPDDAVAEMSTELEQHLIEAERDGRSVEDVIGDWAAFAEGWAQARANHRVEKWDDVRSGRTRRRRQSRRDAILYGSGAVALIAAAAVATQGGSDVDDFLWAWLWTVFAIALVVVLLSWSGATSQAGLPDGESFVFVTGAGDGTLAVDRAELLTGEAARAAAVEDGLIGSDEDLPNDFYIRNQHVESVQVGVAEAAAMTVWRFDGGGQLVEDSIEPTAFAGLFADSGSSGEVYGFDPAAFPVTLDVEDGVVTRLSQVYLP